MTEEYVSFDTARLLKEAGFDEFCRWASRSTGNRCVMHARNSMLPAGYVSRPTQALAARWLREHHNLHVFACMEYATGKWFYCVADTAAPCAREGMDMPEANYSTHEGAMESGIQEAIKLIKQ